ncbi:MAG TPA: hypothetical protein VF258_01250, partial [Luteolibacter sp.]
ATPIAKRKAIVQSAQQTSENCGVSELESMRNNHAFFRDSSSRGSVLQKVENGIDSARVIKSEPTRIHR